MASDFVEGARGNGSSDKVMRESVLGIELSNVSSLSQFLDEGDGEPDSDGDVVVPHPAS